jgi:triosephosphate isomerase
VGVFVLPIFPALPAAQRILTGSEILYGAQDVHWEERGPFTGEVSPLVLSELGCTIVEIGHAERRTLFGETDEIVRLKTKAVLEQGLVPLICIGESEQIPTDQSVEHALEQVRSALGLVNGRNQLIVNDSSGLIVAYEPVWAIGAQASAPVEYITPVAHAIRDELSNCWPGNSAILYGGTVRPQEASSLIHAGVDGLFVGRAALDMNTFFEIIQAYQVEIH